MLSTQTCYNFLSDSDRMIAQKWAGHSYGDLLKAAITADCEIKKYVLLGAVYLKGYTFIVNIEKREYNRIGEKHYYPIG